MNWDLDENGVIALTEKNANLVRFIIRNDSSYRESNDPKSPKSASYIFRSVYKNGNFTYDFDSLFDYIKKIDAENSTHLSVTPIPGETNKGREFTTDYILKIKDLKERLLAGDSKLVEDIALNAIKGRCIFSFASKFCTFTCRNAFHNDVRGDNFSIYDSILSEVLPYFAAYYLGKNYLKKNKSTISREFASKNDLNYKGYLDLIDEIKKASFKKTNYMISREDFDSLLWYYFKGPMDRIEYAISKLDSKLIQM